MIRCGAIAVMVAMIPVCARAQAAAPPEHAATRSYNTALGVECEHCHDAAAFVDSSKPTFDFARRMQRMVTGLNEGPLKSLGGVVCWSCHRGHATPPRLPRADWESIATAHRAEFSGRDDLSLTMSVYSASLGVACGHCHVDGNWTDRLKPAHRTVALMLTIFELIPAYFDGGVRAPRTQCYMCHQGQVSVEQRSPRDDQ